MQKSIRFEVRPGDCGYTDDWNDCDTDRERHELSGERMSGGEWWYAWSIFLPKDFINVYPTKLALGQFHQQKNHVVWMFQNQGEVLPGGYWVDNGVPGYTKTLNKILTQDEMIEKWNDILVNVKWSKKVVGFFKFGQMVSKEISFGDRQKRTERRRLGKECRLRWSA